MGTRISLLAAALAATACASNPEPGPGRGGGGPGAGVFQGGRIAQPMSLLMVSMDADFDRLVSVDEITAGMAREWRSADADGDGAIGGFEFADWAEAALGGRDPVPGRMAFDTDGDGSIVEEEFSERLLRSFAALDGSSRSRAESVLEDVGALQPLLG